ncbi:MAG: bifunctional glutamate N-acetyltransferase/amino-acid acetyltransferase ArgJ [Epulopiscium sp.]|nr:bifunctional glutamate N-acetyltransferase/amino-acid acetyltransferase ArgJ [Candidatus Epulonipiscium sp.]
MKVIQGGVTVPLGFQAAGEHIGIKKKRKDLSLLYSQEPAKVAGVFTTNVVKAAPVLWNQKIVNKHGKVQAIVINSGNANACTGDQGMKDTETMAEVTANCLGLQPQDVLVASTGVIGVLLPMKTISAGIQKTIPLLSSSLKGGSEAAEGIMTTDTFRKEMAIELPIGNKTIRIGGMAKGSGMIHPNMATMLSFITTDACISEDLLQKALKETVEDSYHMISVDGDTSTNDMVVILANGLAKNKPIEEDTGEYFQFKKGLQYINNYLAQQIVKDGEGATKFLEVQIQEAKTKEEAKQLAMSILTSNLVKTAFFGEDANWGRILASMGYSGVTFDPHKITICFKSAGGSIVLMKQGSPLNFDEEKAKKILKEEEIQINVYLDSGKEKAVGWGCDLSYDYVKINGDYRT